MIERELKRLVRSRGASISAPLAAASLAMAAHPVSARPGDLDPAFAASGLFQTSAGWPLAGMSTLSVAIQDADHFLVSRGVRCPGISDWFGRCYAGGLLLRIDGKGVPDPAFLRVSGFPGASFEVLDTATQIDGKIIAVLNERIRPVAPGSGSTVIRLEASGSLDATFGASGYAAALGPGSLTSIVLDPDGRIVVAGTSNGDLVVKRLAADGAPDASFAEAGTFVGATMGHAYPVVVHAGDGYAVLAQDAPDSVPRCRVLALTAGGEVSTSYGDSGYASLGAAAGVPVVCRSLQSLPDGRVQVAGTMDGRAFAIRLDGAGAVAAGFDASAAAALIADVRAAAVASDDSSVIAGPSAAGESGVRVLRLRDDGSVDDAFGDAGTTWIDMPFAHVNDLALTSDRGVVLVGDKAYPSTSWVARLLGDNGGDNPGLVGFKWSTVQVAQDSPHAVLTVRRTGGRSGAVSVAFRAHAPGTPSLTPSAPATEGSDFVAVSGRLDWADGDTGDRTVPIPMAPDNGPPEEPEAFEVELYDASGAGVGTGRGTVEIAGDDVPAGFLAIGAAGYEVGESQDVVQIPIVRKYDARGSVSVTLTPVAGSATTGSDYAAAPVTVSWTDGESDTKYASVHIINDAAIEASETFTIELSNASGGAAIGSQSTATVTINDDDPAAPAPPPDAGGGSSGGGGGSSGGGGSLDWLLCALIAASAARRAVFRA